MLNKSIILLLIIAGSSLLSGCVTNGDPRTGGIFWSESAAQERLRVRRAHLRSVDRDTDRVSSRNRSLRGAAARREAMLDE